MLRKYEPKVEKILDLCVIKMYVYDFNQMIKLFD